MHLVSTPRGARAQLTWSHAPSATPRRRAARRAYLRPTVPHHRAAFKLIVFASHTSLPCPGPSTRSRSLTCCASACVLSDRFTVMLAHALRSMCVWQVVSSSRAFHRSSSRGWSGTDFASTETLLVLLVLLVLFAMLARLLCACLWRVDRQATRMAWSRYFSRVVRGSTCRSMCDVRVVGLGPDCDE